MNIQKIDISKLNPASYNPRKNLKPEDREYKKIKRSIQEFGYVEPIIINSDFTIIGGHQRYKILKEQGVKEAEVVIVEIDKVKEKAMNIALNKAQGDWDMEALESLLEELREEDFDFEITGFDDEDLEKEFKDFFKSDKTEEELEEIPEVKKEAVSKLGDLFLIDNRHRVLCGDSTRQEDVERLMSGEKADMVFTDPPYNFKAEGGGALYEKYENTQKRIKDIVNFNPKGFLEILPFCFNGNMNCYVFCNKDLVVDYLNFARENKYNYNILVWKKPNCVPFGDSHLPDIEYLILLRKNAIWNNSLKDVLYSRVLEFNKCISKDHPTIKPIELIKNELKISSKINSVVIDPFLGSGSTLIASEETNRICYGMELEQLYIDVILRRYHELYPDKKIECLNRKFDFDKLFKSE